MNNGRAVLRIKSQIKGSGEGEGGGGREGNIRGIAETIAGECRALLK